MGLGLWLSRWRIVNEEEVPGSGGNGEVAEIPAEEDEGVIAMDESSEQEDPLNCLMDLLQHDVPWADAVADTAKLCKVSEALVVARYEEMEEKVWEAPLKQERMAEDSEEEVEVKVEVKEEGEKKRGKKRKKGKECHVNLSRVEWDERGRPVVPFSTAKRKGRGVKVISLGDMTNMKVYVTKYNTYLAPVGMFCFFPFSSFSHSLR